MKKLSLVALLVILSSCKSEQVEGDAIYAKVLLDPAVSATCVLVEVRDPVTHEVLGTDWAPRENKNELQVAVFRGTLPPQVEIAARPYLDGNCQDDEPAKTANGVFEKVLASFGKGITQAEDLRLKPGTDRDEDTYVDLDSGGLDCGDNNKAVKPSAVETCSDKVDLNCDNKRGCEACANACVEPTATIALTLPTSPVMAGTCGTGTVQLKDAKGANTVATAELPIGLQALPAAGFSLFSDGSCTTPATQVKVVAGEGGASFSFKGQAVGPVEITATASGVPAVKQNVQIVPGPGNLLVFTTPARTATAGVCSAVVTVQSRDAQGNPAPVTAATAISLSAPQAANLKFYSDASCSTEVTSANIVAGQSLASFYFKGTKSGPVTVTLISTSLTGSSQEEMINPASPSALVLSGTQTTVAGICSAAATVALQDAFGNPATTTSRTIGLSAGMGSPVSFFANPDCTGTSVVIPQGGGSANFYYRSDVANSYTVTATSTGLTQATMGVTINPGPPTVLAFTTAALTPTAGVCSAVATVQLRDSRGNAVKVGGTTAVTLSATGPDGLQFFANQGCGGTAVTSVDIPANESNASFYFKSNKAGSGTLNVAQGAATGSQPVTIRPDTASVLVFPQSPLSVVAGDCTAITLQTRDSFGNLAPVASSQTMGLTSNLTNLNISSQTGCGNTVNTVTVAAQASSATFYVRGTTIGTGTVTASRTGYTGDPLGLTVTAAAPNKIAFTTPARTLEVNTCSPVASTVQVQDSFNNAASVSGIPQINLSASSASLTFFSDSGCTDQVTSIVPAGNSSASFYFKGSAVEGPTITASHTNLLSGTQQQTITTPQPTALVFTASPTSLVAGNCSGTVTVQAQAQGAPATVIANTPVDLVAAPSTGFSFHASTNCSGQPVNQVSIGANQSSVSFSFKSTKAAQVGLTASSSTIAAAATQNVTITAAAPTKLVLSTPERSARAGSCSAAITVESRDANDNLSPVTGARTLTLNQSGTPSDPNFKFYSDPACNTQTGTSIPLPDGASSVSFYFRGEKVRTVDVAVSGNPLTATPVQTQRVTAGLAKTLRFAASTPAQTLLAGTCTARTVESLDEFNNPGDDALTLELAGSLDAEFFSEASCSTLTSQATISAGNSSTSFYFKPITGGINAPADLTLTVSSGTLTPATQTETINPTVRTGTCTIGGGSGVGTCTISPALAGTARAFLVFQATTQSQNSAQANVRCFLSSNSQVRCERGDKNSGNAITARWSVAEFPNVTGGVAVQHQSVPCDKDVNAATLSAVVKDRTFLLLSSERNSTDQGNTIPRLAELMTTTMAEIRKTGGCAGADTNHLQAVDYPGAVVQRGLTSLSNAASKEVTLSPAVALDRSILLYSYISDGSGNKICDRVLRGTLTNSGQKVTFSRGDGDDTNCLGSQFTSISWETVQFPPGTVVHQVTRQLTGLSATVTLPSPVDRTRTIVLAGGQWASGQVHGEGRYSFGELMSEMRAQAYLTDNSTLMITRETANASATFTVYVVQLKP